MLLPLLLNNLLQAAPPEPPAGPGGAGSNRRQAHIQWLPAAPLPSAQILALRRRRRQEAELIAIQRLH